jgi:LacI family transcriptional regulator
MANRNSEPRVLIVLDGSMGWSRGVLRGFFDAGRRQHWRLLHHHPGNIEWMADVWQPAVVVLQASVHAGARKLRCSAVISVNDDSRDRRAFASVCLDEEAIGKLAAEHLLAKGLTQLTTFRFNDGRFAAARERAFEQTVKARGARYVPGWWVDGADPPRSHEDPAALASWVAGLPRPVGVFACADSWARIVAQYAEVSGVRIPEDMALVGVDNDRMVCEIASPTLSSVAIPWRTVGEQAAAFVQRALSGTNVVGERVIVPPVDVIARRSTDVSAIDDPIVARAVAWVTSNSSRRLTLDAVAHASACSRQRLERRFRRAIGRSVMQEVQRARAEAAKRLLSTTNSALLLVAKQCGFADAASFSVAFRRETGMAPGAYRRQFQGLDLTED